MMCDKRNEIFDFLNINIDKKNATLNMHFRLLTIKPTGNVAGLNKW